VAVDAAGSLLIVDTGNQRIRRVDGTTGIITTVAGNGNQGFSGDGGPATSASLNSPVGVAVDAAGNLLVADTFNDRIRQVSGL
jgi:DNA-binding beta-propeller fold protein YncE